MLTDECDDGIQLRTLRHQQQPPRRHFGSHEFTETEMLMNNTTATSVVDRRCARDSLVVGNAIIINEYDQDEEDYRQHLQLPPPPQIDEQSDVDDDELVAVNGQAGSFGSAAAAAIALSASRLIPNKSQVLLYFQSATCFKLRHTGGELQVTDSADFPLFDVWIEMDCCRCTWVLESYGKTVLLMNENSSASSVSSKHQSAIVITDWNGDLFGHLISGDPFIVQNAEKTTIAKLIVDESRVAPLAEERGLSSSSTNVDDAWISVLESSGNGRPIAKIDANDVIVYGADVGFQLKLLTLAAIVRCTATWSMPGRRRIGGSANFCCASISSLLNCCAYCFY